MNVPSTGSNASAIVSNHVELYEKQTVLVQPSERFQKPSPNASENSHLQLMLGIAIPCRVETGLTRPQGCEQACSNLRSPAEVMQKRTGVTSRISSSCTWSKSYIDADLSSRPPSSASVSVDSTLAPTSWKICCNRNLRLPCWYDGEGFHNNWVRGGPITGYLLVLPRCDQLDYLYMCSSCSGGS